MTTRDFIKKNYGVHGGIRKCSSVMVDTNGTVYSYGYHYPLVFQTVEDNGLYFINTSGYSSTTGKHIRWAKDAVGYGNYIEVDLPGRNAYHGEAHYSVDDVLYLLENKRDTIFNEMAKKKRRNTQVFQSLMTELKQAEQDILKVRGVA